MERGTFTFRLPKEIYFGPGEGKRVGELIKRLGKKVLLVTGKSFVQKYGILEEVIASLEASGLRFVVFSEVEPEPSLQAVDRGVSLAYRESCDLVVSLGGGSVLDCGKAIAGVRGNGESVIPFFEGAPLPRNGIPWVAMPTTAGTGSEMTTNAVLTDYRRKLKKSFRSPSLSASVVILGPLYTRFMNRYLTATSGIDALVQAIEAYLSPRGNPITDFLALEAVEILWKFLSLAVEEGDNFEYRQKMALGSMISAMAFANASSGPVHGLAHMIGPDFSIAHGEACGLLFPAVARFNQEVLSERYLKLAQVVGFQEIETWIQAFETLMQRVGLRTRLRDFGVAPEELSLVVREERIGANIRENPRPMDRKDLEKILREVF
ncbi:MAG: iron-containing alcohol dehydrogenase family protein [Candidatus Caldatribacteriaceae bacterium]